MEMILTKILSLVAALVLFISAPTSAQAMTFDRIVVFGGSVSDPGNVFALTGIANRSPYDKLDPFLIPTGAYNVGGHHLSNGATWIEQFARPLGLSRYVQPAFQGSSRDASNYAVAGARARPVPDTLDLPEQMAAFLNDVGNHAPADALYIMDFGGNDVRDALTAGDPEILSEALTVVAENLATLYTAGARKFLVLNVADIGQIPSVRILDSLFPGAAQNATFLTQAFNTGLGAVLAVIAALPDVEIAQLDIFLTVHEIVADPAAFGLTDAVHACITPNLPPFTCKTPDEFLFWDGIHPTKVVHAIFAEEAAEILEK